MLEVQSFKEMFTKSIKAEEIENLPTDTQGEQITADVDVQTTLLKPDHDKI